MPVQRLKVAIRPLDLPCSGSVTHSGEILTIGNSHGKKPNISLPNYAVKLSFSKPLWYIDGAEVWLQSFLTPVLDRGEWSASCPIRFTLRKELRYALNRGLCGPPVVKVLCYKSEGRWFDPSWCQWIFH